MYMYPHTQQQKMSTEIKKEGGQRREGGKGGREGRWGGGRKEGCVSVLPRYTRAYQLNNMLFYIHERSTDHTPLKMAGLDVIQIIHCRGMYTF